MSDNSNLRQLLDRLDPQQTLTGLADATFGSAPFDRMGVAMLQRPSDRFRVLGVIDRKVAPPAPGYAFCAKTTAGGWVTRYRMPFVGAGLNDVREYPGTAAQMSRDGFVSNCVLPIDFGSLGGGVVFWLSRRPGAFTPATLALCLRLREVIEPATRAFVAAMDMYDGGEKLDTPAPLDSTAEGGLTLAHVERRHIESILRQTNGIIEGPRGAARLLGLKPSTLRHRMRQLGVQRP